MTNAEKFQEIFKEFATEVWAFPEKDFLTWLNAEYREPTTKNNLGVDCISRQSVLDKIQRLVNAEQNNIDENGDYMNYARERVNAYEAIQFFVENDCLCPSVTPQPRKGYLSIDDVMAVFDDFMCGEVDEDGTETFLEMLKDKAESESI